MNKECFFCKLSYESKAHNSKFCSSKCKEKQWRINNPEKSRIKSKKWKDNNKDRIKKTSAIWQEKNKENNKEKYNAQRRERYDRDKELILARNRIWQKENPDIIKRNNAKWQKNNPEKNKENCKKYRINNKDKLKQYRIDNKEHYQILRRSNSKRTNMLEKKRKDANPMLRINDSMKTGIRLSLKGNKKGRKWESLVNFTLLELKTHLENLFDENMSWSNYGSYWHIDHVEPQSWFSIEKAGDEEFLKCWSLSNLQPMEASENCSKRNYFASPPII